MIASVVGANESIQQAIDRATPGDTLKIMGVHDEDVTIHEAHLTLQGEAGATIDGDVIVKADHVTIKDLEISDVLETPRGSFADLTLRSVNLYGKQLDTTLDCVAVVNAGEDLQAIVDAVVDGATICLAPGISTEGVQTDNTLTLIRIGSGPIAILPEASFTFSPENPQAGESVTFDASASVDPAGLRAQAIQSYGWDFGDGESGSGETTTHSYSDDGDYDVTLTVTDGGGVSDSAIKTISVGNRAPTAMDDGDSTDENTAISRSAGNGVLANDADPNGGDSLTVSQIEGAFANVGSTVAGSNGGQFTVNADGSYAFDPNGDLEDLADGESRTTSVSYTVSDGEGGSDSATLTITAAGVADPPSASDDSDSTDEDTAISRSAANGVLANDSDPDDDLLTVSQINASSGNVGSTVAGSNGGQFTVNADGSYAFDPNGDLEDLADGESRTTSVSYTVSDGKGGSDSATLTITISGVNDAPIASDDSDSTDEDTAISRSAANGVLANDSDPDGAMTVSEIEGSSANVGSAVAGSNGGQFSVNADGSYAFDPNGDFEDLADGESRTTSVSYTVSDGEGGSDSATLTITVNGVNDPPTTVGDS